MAQDRVQQPDPQDGDLLSELQAEEPDLRTEKRSGSHPAESSSSRESGQETAKESSTVRGHDSPQAVRHAG